MLEPIRNRLTGDVGGDDASTRGLVFVKAACRLVHSPKRCCCLDEDYSSLVETFAPGSCSAIFLSSLLGRVIRVKPKIHKPYFFFKSTFRILARSDTASVILRVPCTRGTASRSYLLNRDT